MQVSFAYPLVLIFLPLWALGLIYMTRKSRSSRRFWLSGLQWLIVAILLVNLAGMTLSSGKGGSDFFLLLDVSASISTQEKNRSINILRKWSKSIGLENRTAIILFARQAFVERPLSPGLTFTDFRSFPDESETDMVRALDLLHVLAAATRHPRIVLLTDGRSTTEGTIPKTLEIARAGMPIDIFPLGGSDEAEAYIASLKIPERLRGNEPFSVEILLRSGLDTEAKLHWFVRGKSRQEKKLFIPKDRSYSVTLTEKIEEVGLYEYQVRILPEKDTRIDNNQISGRLLVSSQPEILYLSSKQAEGTESIWARFLATQPYRITYRNVNKEIPDLQGFDMIIMDNIRSWEITPEFLKRIKERVINESAGLLFMGGISSFSLGEDQKNILEDILPVKLGLPEKKHKPSVALVILMDKSGSMEAGNKMAYARKAVNSAIEWLHDEDRLGIIAFDIQVLPILPLRKKKELTDLEDRLERLVPSGGTKLTPALFLAKEWLEPIKTRHKLILILSDGKVQKEDLELLKLTPQGDVRISTVGIEPEADHRFLKELAEKNGGHSYLGKMGEDIPRFFLQEVARLSREMILPETVKPKIKENHPVLKGISEKDIPGIGGYVTTGLKENSSLLLEVEDGDPLLTIWQVGLGRSAVLSTDLLRWGSGWLKWEDFPKLWAQLVRWLIGKGNYFSDSEADSRIVQAEMKERILPELRNFGPDLEMLRKMADITGGRLLSEGDNPFVGGAANAKGTHKIDPAPYLLLVAIFLFLAEMWLYRSFSKRYESGF